MAWQVLVMNIRGKMPPTTEDQCLPLGTADELRRRISESFPGTDWSGSASGHFIAEDQAFTIVFWFDGPEPRRSMMMDIRGGRESITAIARFAKLNGWQLFDCSGDWLNLDEPSDEGWSGYDALRRGHISSDGGEECV